MAKQLGWFSAKMNIIKGTRTRKGISGGRRKWNGARHK